MESADAVSPKIFSRKRPSHQLDQKIKHTPFDHYPDSLKVGDLVRRGPTWHWGDRDESNGLPCPGIVKSVSGPEVAVQ